MGLLKIYKFFLHGVLKLAGISPKKIEIEPGTVVNFWVPTQTTTKPAVVFLHGFAFDGILTWQFQVLALANHYSVYVPDFVFFGDSITDKSERSVEFQAECIAKGLKKLGVQKCTLVGFSFGGIVGFKMAEIYPELVHSLVVTCSVMALTESISKVQLQRLGFNSWPDYLLPESVQGVETLIQLGSHSFPKFPKFIYKEILEVISFDSRGICKNRREKVELLKALVISDEEFTVPSYHQRIHVFWGKNDKILEVENAHYIQQ
ncbi:monoacylglycerol lipase abhd6-A-like isoform X2 [Gossypium australe]|uniref:Monoacylglycerol lipase abhd6-A-like isoform X2 n=1 Tax=Gossypium australe TaxID=47621 RepID=A0A5B6V1C4_9ROSI|nr:monoacylglycerol lipase abhd6-A-like isoform X2 [Gossypium australe]